jgi:hypothetical protein
MGTLRVQNELFVTDSLKASCEGSRPDVTLGAGKSFHAAQGFVEKYAGFEGFNKTYDLVVDELL